MEIQDNVDWSNDPAKYSANNAFGHHDDCQSNVTGLTVECHEHACSHNNTFDVTGHAAAFEKCAHISSSDPAASKADAEDLANFLQNNM